MANYVIHACESRMWYVNDYLLPSLHDQGISDTRVYCDTKNVGCLESCMSIFSHMPADGGAWHIQDDVVISRDFRKKTEKYSGEDIVCGFVFEKDESLRYDGYVVPKRMWWSFPCIYIPNRYARECAQWYYKEARFKREYADWVKAKKFDDAFFKEFMKLHYPNWYVLNLKPNLVDHVDYLIGGSVINGTRNYPQTRAVYFNDTDIVDSLELELKNRV